MRAILAGMLGVSLLVVLMAGCNQPKQEPVAVAPAPPPPTYPEAQVPKAEPQPVTVAPEPEPEPEPPPAVDTGATPRKKASAKPAPKEHYAPAKKPGRTYTIKKGDTLQKISQKFYGTTKNWRRIYEANRKTIKDPDQLVEGDKIVVP